MSDCQKRFELTDQDLGAYERRGRPTVQNIFSSSEHDFAARVKEAGVGCDTLNQKFPASKMHILAMKENWARLSEKSQYVQKTEKLERVKVDPATPNARAEGVKELADKELGTLSCRTTLNKTVYRGLLAQAQIYQPKKPFKSSIQQETENTENMPLKKITTEKAPVNKALAPPKLAAEEDWVDCSAETSGGEDEWIQV